MLDIDVFGAVVESQVFAMAMADWLSICRAVGLLLASLSSVNSHLSQLASLMVWAPAMYLAFMLESVIDDCFCYQP